MESAVRMAAAAAFLVAASRLSRIRVMWYRLTCLGDWTVERCRWRRDEDAGGVGGGRLRRSRRPGAPGGARASVARPVDDCRRLRCRVY